MPTGSPTRPGWCAGTWSTPTPPYARWPAGSRRGSRSRSTAASPRHLPGTAVAAANSKAYGGRDVPGPRRRARRRPARHRDHRDRVEAPLPARCCRRCSRASTSGRPKFTCFAAGRCRSPPTGRSPSTPTEIRSPSCRRRSPRCRARSGCWFRPHEPGAGSEDRRRARGRRAGAARRTGRWHEPAGEGADASRARGDRRTVGPAAAGLGGRVGHQRQDHDRGDGRVDPRAHEGTTVVHNRAGANMAGGIASTLLAAARRGGGIDGELGLFEVDEFWLGQLTDCAPSTRAAALQPVPGSARSLRRARDDRRPLGGDRHLGAPHHRAGSECRRSADRRPRPRSPGHALFRRRGSARSRCPSSNTPPTPSTAAAAGIRIATRRSFLAISATTSVPTAASGVRARRSAPSGSRSTAPGRPSSP